MLLDERRPRVAREPRRQLQKQPAWMTVDDGVTMRECFVLDVSPGGAKISTDLAFEIRDTFELALMPGRPARKACEVVWRRGQTYGVKFVGEVG